MCKNYFNQYNNIITRKSFIAKMIAAKQNHSLNKTERERERSRSGENQPNGDELTLLVKRREETPLSPSRLPSDSRADAHRVSTKSRRHHYRVTNLPDSTFARSQCYRFITAYTVQPYSCCLLCTPYAIAS